MTAPVEVIGAARRGVWLDAEAAGGWGGTSTLAWLDDDDVSLSYDAARHEVRRHRSGRAEVVGDDIFAALDSELAARPGARWYGYLGYACRGDLRARADDSMPDAIWMRPSHVRRWRCGAQPRRPRRATPGPAPAIPDAYRDAFELVQHHLRAGNSYQVNLTYRIDVESSIDPVVAYLRLRELNPAPYAALVKHDLPSAAGWLLSASPETYVSIADGWLETRPIKGTTPRGGSDEEDEASRRRLLADPRLRAENLIIVDLLRNDVAMVSQPGTVEVPALMAVESHPSVHHLVSTVRGRLAVGTVEAVRALFPAGSMTGAPKRRTMEIIDSAEGSPRGAYAGAFGEIGAARATLAVTIRSLATGGDGRWRIGTGGGVTVRSRVEEEAAEAGWKATGLLPALALP